MRWFLKNEAAPNSFLSREIIFMAKPNCDILAKTLILIITNNELFNFRLLQTELPGLGVCLFVIEPQSFPKDEHEIDCAAVSCSIANGLRHYRMTISNHEPEFIFLEKLYNAMI